MPSRELVAPAFLALTVGIVVVFVGVLVTQRMAFLRRYSNPEPVTGGFIAWALAFWGVHAVLGVVQRQHARTEAHRASGVEREGGSVT